MTQDLVVVGVSARATGSADEHTVVQGVPVR